MVRSASNWLRSIVNISKARPGLMLLAVMVRVSFKLPRVTVTCALGVGPPGTPRQPTNLGLGNRSKWTVLTADVLLWAAIGSVVASANRPATKVLRTAVCMKRLIAKTLLHKLSCRNLLLCRRLLHP